MSPSLLHESKLDLKVKCLLHRRKGNSGLVSKHFYLKVNFFGFIAALFIIAKQWKQPLSPLVNKWINKMWHIHTVEYYSAFKRKEVVAHAIIEMKLEDMLSEISHSKKH